MDVRERGQRPVINHPSDLRSHTIARVLSAIGPVSSHPSWRTLPLIDQEAYASGVQTEIVSLAKSISTGIEGPICC
jgi:hypothetical protein